MSDATDQDRDDRVSRIGLDEGLVKEVQHALAEDAAVLASALASSLHPADLADLLQILSPEQRVALVRELDQAFDPETLTHLDVSMRDQLMREVGSEWSSAMLAQLDTDDALELVASLEEEEQLKILSGLPLPDRAALEQGLAFPEYSAGRLMQRELVAVPEYWVVGQTIDYLRSTPDLPDEFYDIYIVDPRFRPVGSVPISNVLKSKRSIPMRRLKIKETYRISASLDQEEVAFLFRQYGLVSAPVVDDGGRLLGVITVDDVVDVIQEEAEDDILKLGGVQETDVFQPPLKTGLRRMPWLFVNLATAVIASLVIALFEDAIEQIVALAVLMPIVASMGGNAGTQTLTVAVRSLAVRELTASNTRRMLIKEFLVSVLNGCVFLACGAALALFWFGNPQLAIVFGAAMIITLMAAGLAGITIPMVLHRFGLDPAVSSAVFLTTVTDVVGFFAFLGLAVAFLL